MSKFDLVVDSETGKSGFYVWNKPTVYVDESDDRYSEYVKEKEETGISPEETWSLCDSIAVFLVPRLKAFKEETIGYPVEFSSIEEWQAVLDKMIYSFESFLASKEDKIMEEDTAKVQEGLNLFAKYFTHLWW